MALFARLANWFDHVFDMSEDDGDALDGMDADAGLLMQAPKGAPPAIPQLPAQPAEQAAPEGADPADPYGVDSAESMAEAGASAVAGAPAAEATSADDTVIEETPAPAPTRPAVKVVSLAKAVDAEPAGEPTGDAAPDEDGAPDAEAGAADEGETPDGETPSEEPAPLAVASGDSGEKPPEDALLSAFKRAGELSEVAVYTNDMEDVAIADLLKDAREVLAMLPKKKDAA
jgi:hypothetical protein